MKVSKNNAEHYEWREVCDGWHLVKSTAVSVIEEKMPAGTSEIRHYHERARQFFYVLAGQVTLAVQGKAVVMNAREGIEIAPGVPHQMMNNSQGALEFIVVSTPPSHGDRVVAD